MANYTSNSGGFGMPYSGSMIDVMQGKSGLRYNPFEHHDSGMVVYGGEKPQPATQGQLSALEQQRIGPRRGPTPVIGGTPRGQNPVGGTTWAPGAIPVAGPGGRFGMSYGGPSSWGGTQDDGYRIGPGGKTGDGKFHDTFGSGIDDIKAHGPMAGMGRDLAAGSTPPDKFAQDKRPWGTFAEGGPTTLPAPKPDNIHAKLGADEFVMDRPTVLFHGLDKMMKLQKQAKEGLMMMKNGEDADESTEPHGMADMREDRAEGEMDDPMGYAQGGLVISNPYADDPALYAARQQQARDDELFKSGIIDYGGGNRTLANRYGTGYAQPMITQQPGVFNDGGNAATVTPGKGVTPMPDVVPADSPWHAGAMPFDAAAQREDIASAAARMLPFAEGRRAADLHRATTEATLIPKGRKEMVVPSDRTFANGTPALNTLEAPWESDKRMAAERAAGDPLADFIPRATDRRRFMRTPQGIQLAAEMRAQGTSPMVTPEMAAQMGMEVASLDSRGNATFRKADPTSNLPDHIKQLDAIIADKKLPLATRERAKRQRDESARSTITGGTKAPSHSTIYNPDTGLQESVQWDEKAGGWMPMTRADGGSAFADKAPAGGAKPGASPVADWLAKARKQLGITK